MEPGRSAAGGGRHAGRAQRLAYVLRVGSGGYPPVAAAVDPARQPGGLLERRLDVAPLDADRRRADEPLFARLLVGEDLAHADALRIEAALAHRLAQVAQRLWMGR